jgi:hypothetical protein
VTSLHFTETFTIGLSRIVAVTELIGVAITDTLLAPMAGV